MASLREPLSGWGVDAFKMRSPLGRLESVPLSSHA
jgi:hypothetical protein